MHRCCDRTAGRLFALAHATLIIANLFRRMKWAHILPLLWPTTVDIVSDSIIRFLCAPATCIEGLAGGHSGLLLLLIYRKMMSGNSVQFCTWMLVSRISFEPPSEQQTLFPHFIFWIVFSFPLWPSHTITSTQLQPVESIQSVIRCCRP